MTGNVIEQATSYRRGLVLGLTMAEVVILIIFILLLVLGTLLALKERERQRLETKLQNQEASYAVLEDKIRPWLSTIQNRDPDDLFLELRRTSDLEAKVERLKSLLTEADKVRARSESVMSVLHNAKLSKDPKNLAEEIAQMQAAVEASKASGPDRMREVLAEHRRLEAENNALEQGLRNKEGQIANLRKRIKGAGGGTEHPPCWATPKGKTEYIFNVDLLSDGFVVRDNHMPHRSEERKQLPLSGITFDSKVSNAQFLREMLPLRKWSDAHDCRFFVRAIDSTGPNEKAIYKRQLWDLEQRFYKWEVR